MTEQQLTRQAERRLAILQHAEEVTGNVARTCRYYGISRQCFYTWKRRYDDEGLDGLRDRSCRPHHSPLATHTDVVGKIVYLRQHYHFGPHKISMYLARYHDISISPSGVYRILKRLDLNRLPANQRHKTYDRCWKRYEKPLPGHQVQIDVKFIEPVAGARAKKYYQYTAIDDCTRLRVLRIYPRNNQVTAFGRDDQSMGAAARGGAAARQATHTSAPKLDAAIVARRPPRTPPWPTCSASGSLAGQAVARVVRRAWCDG